MIRDGLDEGKPLPPTRKYRGCPACRTALAAASGEPLAEGRSPRCEAGLWSLNLPSGPWFFVRRPDQTPTQFLATLAGPALGASAEDIAAFLRAADPLDMVEFLEELEVVSGLVDGMQGD